METPERNAVIAGLGMSQIGRRTGIDGVELTAAACRAAIADAGLEPPDIDGLATLGDTPLAEAAAVLGLEPTWAGGGYTRGGLLTPLMAAVLAVGDGQVRNALVYRTVNMMGGAALPETTPSPEASLLAAQAQAWIGPLLTMHAYAAPNWLAMHCRRHMHQYGTTKEQLGAVAIATRAHAALNPLATYRDPITMADYLGARPMSDPFGLYDCDVPVDGSIAFVISSAARAADLPNPPVRIDAIGGSDGAGGWDQRPDYPAMCSVDAAAEMWNRTDLTATDLDCVQVYDGFTFIALAWLEALGIVGTGESGPYVEGGARIGPGGALPMNTYGGQLSAGRMHGYWLVHEAALQIRGHGGERQVPGCEVTVAAAGGGPFAGAMLLTR